MTGLISFMNTIGERLKMERERLQMTQERFAELGKVQKRSQIHYEQDEREPKAGYFAGIAGAGADVGYILTGVPTRYEVIAYLQARGRESEIAPGHTYCIRTDQADYRPENALSLPGYIPVPYYADTEASTDTATYETVKVSAAVQQDALLCRPEWLYQQFGVAVQHLCLIRIEGDAMVPTFRAGSVVMIDRSITHLNADGIYLLRMDEVLMIRRVQWLPGGILRISSDNTQFLPFEIRQEDVQQGRVEVLGRAVWEMSRI